MSLHPAEGQHIAAAFQERGVDWSTNWEQGEPEFRLSGTSTCIQGVLCHIDIDHAQAWLLMVLEDSGIVSYLAVEFRRDGGWPWHWVRVESPHDAIAGFVGWFALNDEYREAGR